jgi:hypothetical protein
VGSLRQFVEVPNEKTVGVTLSQGLRATSEIGELTFAPRHHGAQNSVFQLQNFIAPGGRIAFLCG